MRQQLTIYSKPERIVGGWKSRCTICDVEFEAKTHDPRVVKDLVLDHAQKAEDHYEERTGIWTDEEAHRAEEEHRRRYRAAAGPAGEVLPDLDRYERNYLGLY